MVPEPKLSGAYTTVFPFCSPLTHPPAYTTVFLFCSPLTHPPAGRDVRYLAGKFDLSDFQPGGRDDPVRCVSRVCARPGWVLCLWLLRLMVVSRFETKLQQRSARWGSSSTSHLYSPSLANAHLYSPSPANYAPSPATAAPPPIAAYPMYMYAQQPQVVYTTAPPVQDRTQQVSQAAPYIVPPAAVPVAKVPVAESPVRPASGRQQRNVKYEVYNSGWI